MVLDVRQVPLLEGSRGLASLDCRNLGWGKPGPLAEAAGTQRRPEGPVTCPR